MIDAISVKTPIQQNEPNVSGYDRMHFACIRFVHETLYGLFVDPFDKLSAAGLKEGQEVLEVGCGPGYFTIPATRIVGEKGHVRSIDINPAATDYLRCKIKKRRVENVEVTLADASATGLPAGCVDVAFLFGVIHAFPKLDELLKEMHRVLRPKGKLSVQSRRSEELVEVVSASGLFQLGKEDRGVNVFDKLMR